MHPDDLLVIQACAASPSHAVSAWTELVESHGWMTLPNSVARFLPMIHLNTRSSTDVPYADRLRGVYRASWAGNLTRIAVVKPLLVELRQAGVDPVVIKGAALCALTDRWGFRRMGDLDLVVPSKSAGLIARLLREQSFSRITPEEAAHHSDVEGTWEGPHEALVDIHFGDRWSRYIGVASGTSIVRESQGFDWRIPSPEACLVIALEHGRIGAGAGDSLQTTLDLHTLSSLCNPEVAEPLLRKADVAAMAHWHAQRLQAAIGTQTPSWLVMVSPNPLPVSAAPAKPRHRTASISTILRRMREWRLRRVRQLDRRRTWGGVNPARLPYALWMESGMLGSLERALYRIGFAPIPDPRRKPVGSTQTQSPPQLAVGGVPRRDLRTRVDLGRDVDHGRRIRVRLPSGLEHRRFLFVGHRCRGLINPKSSPVIDVDLDSQDVGVMDVSLRLYWDVMPMEQITGELRVEWVRA